VGVIQLREDQGLPAEAFARGIVRDEARGQDLQRDVPVETFIAGAVDDAHAAGANLFDDDVVGETLPDH
jgi:hypothetical protein